MKVSVVVPAYNEEDYIEKCLISITSQEIKPDEIIVIDNNSSDKTSDIAKKYADVVIKEKIQGMIHARNRGFNEARYDIIARTDADSQVPKNWIKRIKEHFKNNKNLVGISGTTHFYNYPIHDLLQHSQWMVKVVFAIIKSQLKHNTLYGPNMAIRKSAWEKVKSEVCLSDNEVHEDTDLAIHLGKHGYLHIDNNIVVKTSFRRWKKLFTYFEYTYRLIKTLRRHKYNR